MAPVIQTLSYFCLETSSLLHVGSFGQRISKVETPVVILRGLRTPWNYMLHFMSIFIF